MDGDARQRLVEAVEQAHATAVDAIGAIEADREAPGRVESAVREAEEALSRLAERLKGDG